jgi:hypothetical protein
MSKPLESERSQASDGAGSRTDRVVAIIDHCAAAKALADEIGNRFLAYLLAMTVQEAQSSLRVLTEDSTIRAALVEPD